MEQKNVETKYFINGVEAKLVAQQLGTKIYKSLDEEHVTTYYVTNYDEVIAEFNTNAVIIPENYMAK